MIELVWFVLESQNLGMLSVTILMTVMINMVVQTDSTFRARLPAGVGQRGEKKVTKPAMNDTEQINLVIADRYVIDQEEKLLLAWARLEATPRR